jgi:zinc protease
VEGITEYSLDNGFRVLLYPDASAPTVTINLTVLVGSRHEGYGETGMAHLLEHMVFKGTPQHPKIPKALLEHGAGSNFNGTTWLDRTNYYETMPASDTNLDFGIRLEADRLVNSFIRREDLVSEMTVVRSEFEMGENSPERVLSQRTMAAAYEWHNYGKSTIGNRSDIERVPIERLQAFYRKYYQPDNALLIVVGKFEPDKALAYVARYFGALKRPGRTLDTTYTEEPPQDGERQVTLRRVGSVGVVGVVYHTPAGAHEDFAPLEVLTELLTAAPSGRLYKALVTTKLASSVSGNAMPTHDPGVLEITAQVGRDSALPAVRDTLTQVLEHLQSAPPTAEEVERAKRKLLNDHELLVTRSRRAGIELSDWAALGDWRLFFLHRDRIAKVTPADVSRVASRFLQRNNRTLGLYIPTDRPERAEIPATPVVADLVKNYKGSKAVAEGEAFEATPEAIEKRVQRSELPCGLKVALLPKKSRGQTVVAEMVLRFGNEESLKGLNTAAEALGPMLTRGTKKHNRQQLKDELDRLQARLLIAGGDSTGNPKSLGQVTVAIECKRPNLPAALALLREVLREPSFPSDELDVLKRQRRTMLEKGKTEPMALAMQALRRKLRPYPTGDVRHVLTIDERLAQLNALTVDQVRRLYTEQVGASAGEVVVVGDFAPHETKALVQEIVNDWKASVPYRPITRTAQTDVPGSREDILTPDKANAIYVACHLLAMNDADPDFAALEIADFIFGGGSLSSRLANRVRQQDGLSYSPASHFVADSRDKDGQFIIFAICNPANMERVDRAVAEELDRFIKEGVTPTELAEAKKAYLQQLTVSLSSDETLAGVLSEGLFVGRTLAYHADLQQKIAELTSEQVNAAIRKHLAPQRLVIVRGGDLKKKVLGK